MKKIRILKISLNDKYSEKNFLKLMQTISKEQCEAETSRDHQTCVKATWHRIYCTRVQEDRERKVICHIVLNMLLGNTQKNKSEPVTLLSYIKFLRTMNLSKIRFIKILEENIK